MLPSTIACSRVALFYLPIRQIVCLATDLPMGTAGRNPQRG